MAHAPHSSLGLVLNTEELHSSFYLLHPKDQAFTQLLQNHSYTVACFIAPLTQAVATTLVRRQHKNEIENHTDNRWLQKLPLLEHMLWGGSAMLIVDHIINGEVTYIYPFFTALAQENGALTMLREIIVVGLPMCAAITAIWAAIVAFSPRSSKA